MYQITNVGAAQGGEAFLLVTAQKAALVDSGFAFCADGMIANIKRVLGDRPLDYVLLTHTHYDHASGSAYCRDVWKDVQVVGSAYAAEVFQKPSALEVIRTMNRSAAAVLGAGSYEDKTGGLAIDRVVADGDVVDMGDLRLRVIAAPGHTRCSIAFCSDEHRLLVSCETLGVPAGEGRVMPCYLVGYRMAMDSIGRLAACRPERILIPHFGLYEGEKCTEFMRGAVHWNGEWMRRAAAAFRQGKTTEQVERMFTNLFYTPTIAAVQPKKAFRLNLSYMVPMMLREIENPA